MWRCGLGWALVKTIRNIYSVKGIEIILNLRNYERVKTTERVPARAEGTLLQNFNSERIKPRKKLHS
jgi:hypothetical protein